MINVLSKICVLLFGIVPTFAFFFWVAHNSDLPNLIDPITTRTTLMAMIIWDILLFGVFLALHTLTAGFDRKLYMIILGLSIIQTIVMWCPLNGEIWDLGFSNMWTTSPLVGCLIWLGSRHGALAFVGLREEAPFKYMPPIYGLPHPMHLIMLALFWIAPQMDWDRMLMAIMVTIYLFIAIPIEEARVMVKRIQEERDG